MTTVAVTFAISLVLAVALTPVSAALACRAGWVSNPRSDRWGRRTVALDGGIAIAVAFFAGSLVVVRELDRSSLALLAAGAFMFVVGLLDDRLHLKPHTKFLAQIAVAVGLVEVGFRFGLTVEGFVYFDQLMTILWLVGIGNAFNLLDNMDGLCAGIAAIAAASLSVLCLQSGEFAVAALCAALCGATIGFLRYNFAPARVFMGDSGSLMLGMFLAGAPLLRKVEGQSQSIVSILALPVLVLMIPLLDTTLVTIARRLARRPVSQGGCDHASHRLVALGLSERRAVLFLWCLGAAGGLCALAVNSLDWVLGNLLMPLFLLCIGALGLQLGQVRIYHERDELGELLDRPAVPLLARGRHRRRIAELIIDTLAVAVGFYLANLLRYEAQMSSPYVQALYRQAAPVVIVAHLVAYFASGVYRGIWRHTSVAELARFARAVTIGLLLSLIGLYLLGRLAGMSRTVLVINWILQLGLLAGSRVGYKLLRDVLADGGGERRQVLVIGNGDESDLVLRRLKMDRGLGMEPCGVICEEPEAVGLEIHGVPVLGTSETIRDVLSSHRVSEAVLVDEHYPSEGWDRIRRVCGELGVPTRTIRTQLARVDEGGSEREVGV